MAKLILTITDPATIEMLVRYKTFLKVEDEAAGSMNEIAEGLIVGFLDGHDRFADWRHSAATAAAQPTYAPAPSNVAMLPRVSRVVPLETPLEPRARRQA